MISGKYNNNEENIINTTVVELFALMIFLFILALAAFILSGEAPRGAADPERGGTIPSQKGGILIMPMFEGIPACIYHVKAVEHGKRNPITGDDFTFKDISVPLLFRMSLDTVIGKSDPADWAMTFRNNPLRNEPESIVPFEKAWCAFYQRRTVPTVEMWTEPGEEAMQCRLRSQLHSLKDAELAEIDQSIPRSGEDELNVYHEVTLNGETKSPRKWYNTWQNQVSMADLIDVSHGGDTACRWGILLDANDYCGDDMNEETKIAIQRLNYINIELGYNFNLTMKSYADPSEGGASVKFEGCKETTGVYEKNWPELLRYANSELFKFEK